MMTPSQVDIAVRAGANAIAARAGRAGKVHSMDIEDARAVLLCVAGANLPPAHSRESWEVFAYMAAAVASHRFIATSKLTDEDMLNDVKVQKEMQRIIEQVLLEVHL